jgi:hypothetical protein
MAYRIRKPQTYKRYASSHQGFLPMITFVKLREQYSEKELSYYPGNRMIRYKAFSPFFENLFENKIVYHEKFVCLIRLDDVKVTPKKFSATAVPLISMNRSGPYSVACPSKPWTFSGGWEYLRLCENCLNAPYAGFSLWLEYDRVQTVERLLLEGSLTEALDLTANESRVSG